VRYRIHLGVVREGNSNACQRDGDAVRPLVQAINNLAANPEPPESSKLGGTNNRRLQIGEYREMYEIDGAVRCPPRPRAAARRRRRGP
jgi:hypothetical protein